MKYLWLISLFSFAYFFAQAQKKANIDSLNIVYRQAKHDTMKLQALLNIIKAYEDNSDTLIVLAPKALALSEQVGHAEGQAASFYYLGVGYHHKNNYELSLENYAKAVKILEKIKEESLLGTLLNNIAIIHDSQGYYNEALEYYQKSLVLLEKQKNILKIAVCLTNIGNTYKNLGNYPTSVEYYLKGLRLFEELNSEKNIAYIYNNLGIVYLNQQDKGSAEKYFFKSAAIREQLNDKRGLASCLNNIGNLYLEQGKQWEALEQYQKSLAIYEELKDKRGQAISLNNIGDLQNHLLKHQDALAYYQKALGLNEEIKNKWGMTYSTLGLARAELGLKNFDKGIIYAEKSLAIAQEIKSLAEIKNAYRTLYILHKTKGDYPKALENFQYYTDVKDSIFSEQKVKIIANLESKIELERKQKEVKLLSKNQELLAKDNQLQRIESERQRNARLALEKQAEADRLLALAKQEQAKHKQDSLQALAQKTQLEADNLKAKEQQLKAESLTRQVEIIKAKEAKELQQNITYILLSAFILLLVLSIFTYKAKQQALYAKKEIEIKNEEILQQKEEITLQKELVEAQAQELEKINHTKDKLFAILGHDLRSPIASLEGILNLMNQGMVSQSEFHDFVPHFHKNVKNMQHTLENLLQWSISQMQGMTAYPAKINLQSIIEEKILLFAEVAKAKNITLSTNLSPNLNAWVDENHLRLLLRNLINNALKFTLEGGKIIIETRQQDAKVMLSVMDSGVGMTAEQVQSIFQKNSSFSTYGTNGEKGTGLGLQLCQEIIAKNNGEIWVSSEKGKGSTFSFFLPIA